MKAAIITGIGQISVETVADPICEDREVIIEVAAAGICGTDLHILEGEFAPSLPIIPGHEFSGKIIEVGKKVTEYKVGQLVAADPSLFCGECFYCKRARGNLCLNWNAIGVTKPGGAAQYVAAPVKNLYLLPPEIDVKDAGLIEPLSCAVIEIDPFWIYNKEITIAGSMAVLQSFDRAGDLLASGVLKPDVMISHRFGLDDYMKAVDMFKNGIGRKMTIEPNKL